MCGKRRISRSLPSVYHGNSDDSRNDREHSKLSFGSRRVRTRRVKILRGETALLTRVQHVDSRDDAKRSRTIGKSVENSAYF